jgi:uncharacterized protein YbaA (DUF1428 family)
MPWTVERSFWRGIRTKPGETVVFAWTTNRSRAHSDRVNANVMKLGVQ